MGEKGTGCINYSWKPKMITPYIEGIINRSTVDRYCFSIVTIGSPRGEKLEELL